MVEKEKDKKEMMKTQKCQMFTYCLKELFVIIKLKVTYKAWYICCWFLSIKRD